MTRTAVEERPGQAMAFRHPCVLGSLAAGLILAGLALTIDLPRSAYGFKGDESTYYTMAYSMALDGDFVYRRPDLTRVWKEFSAGPEGIFLKRGKQVDWKLTGRFPFVERVVTDDPRDDRLYFGKSFIYPLFVAPFVRLFGTNGFLVFHALILTLSVAAGASFLSTRGSPGPAIGYSLVFLFCSVIPVYLIWISPEVFNYGLVFLGCYFWLYKEAARKEGGAGGRRWRAFVFSPWSDYAAAALFAFATFSKPIHVVLALPLVFWAAWNRRLKHASLLLLLFSLIVAGLFAANAAITGEFNYQGGDRNTFYGRTGFPFLTPDSVFRSATTHSTNEVPLDVLVNRDALGSVFPRNLVYFVLGRHSGLLPYFAPSIISTLLFLLAWRSRERWQMLVAGTLALASVALLLYMPYTYSGGGGSLGNRYIVGFYPLFLFLTPSLKSLRPVWAGVFAGAIFTAQLVLNPFYSSFYPSELPTRWPYRLLPIELSLIDDMPVSVVGSRVKQPLGGDPPTLGYFLDHNAYISEDGSFWVRGEATTQVVIRVPARQAPDGTFQKLRLRRLRIELRMGDVPNRVKVSFSGSRRAVDAAARETVVLDMEAGRGFPFRRMPGHPANDLYVLSISSRSGYVPMFRSGGTDYRFLGVHVRVEPVYEQ